MVFTALSVGTVYVWGKQAYAQLPAGLLGTTEPVTPSSEPVTPTAVPLARVAGLTAALGFALMPRIFYHAHLNCFDMPVLAMWLFTSYAYFRSVTQRSWFWTGCTVLLYGLLLNTKHNSWLLPFALIAHQLLAHGGRLLRGLLVWRLRVPAVFWLMALVSPWIFYALWPWIWFDTIHRLTEYVKFHTAHVFYNIEFLGETYFRPPFPRSYTWLMTLATVPLITLVLSVLGTGASVRWLLRDRVGAWWQQRRALGLRASLGEDAPKESRLSAEAHFQSQVILWGLCVLASYSPWLSSASPIFGGTKHWATAYPYLCLFGGVGFVLLYQRIAAALPALRRPWLAGALATTCALGPLVMTVDSHPWGLSTYTPIVGGAPGAASLGLNRTFWGYTTGAIQDRINEVAPERATVFVHDTAIQSFRMMSKDGRLRRDLRPQLGVAGSQIGLYQHEPHMLRVEYQMWVDYGTVRPDHVGSYHGVPVVWMYRRP
jgi:hypothetical protein